MLEYSALGHFSEFIYQNIDCNLLGRWGRSVPERGESHVPKEGRKGESSQPVLSLEDIEKAKALSVERSSKRRRLLTAEKKFDLFMESCRSPGRIGEMLRREGLYHTDLARIRAVVEEGALAALRSIRPGRKKKPSVPAEVHEVLLERRRR